MALWWCLSDWGLGGPQMWGDPIGLWGALVAQEMKGFTRGRMKELEGY